MALSSTQTLYSIEGAAHELGVSHQTLRNWIAAGDVIPSVLLNGKQPIFSETDIARIKSTNGKKAL